MDNNATAKVIAATIAVALSSNQPPRPITSNSVPPPIAPIATTFRPPLPITTTPGGPKTTTMDPEILTGQQHMLYASMFTFSTISILLLIYMSIFGRRVRLSGWLFHTINFSVWNVVQLVSFAGTSIGTPLPDYIKDQNFVGRMREIQTGTLTMFISGMIFVLPYHMLCYAFPHSIKSHFFSWIAWIPIMFAINFSAVYMFFKKDFKALFSPNPIDAHLFYVTALYNLVFMVYIVGVVLATCVYFTKLTMHAIAKVKKTPSDIQVMPLTVDLLNLVMVIPYSFIIWFMTMFINVFSFAGYAMTIIHIDINVLLEFVKYFPAFFYDCIMSLLKNQEYLQLFLPCSQFLLTCMFVPYYREQAIFLLSCGYFYGNTEQMLKMPQKAQTFLAANKLLEKIGLNKKWATKAQVSNSARNAVANPNANQERLVSA